MGKRTCPPLSCLFGIDHPGRPPTAANPRQGIGHLGFWPSRLKPLTNRLLSLVREGSADKWNLGCLRWHWGSLASWVHRDSRVSIHENPLGHSVRQAEEAFHTIPWPQVGLDPQATQIMLSKATAKLVHSPPTDHQHPGTNSLGLCAAFLRVWWSTPGDVI